MTIDIISYTDSQFAKLTQEQILEVRSAQLKKNKLLEKLETEKRKEKYRLIKNGVFLSKIWQLYCEKLQREYEQEVENIRDALLFYLRFTWKAEEGDSSNVPYSVNYSLTMEERFAIVKSYYESAFADAVLRYETFAKDEVAVAYLGELYAPLHDHFYILAYKRKRVGLEKERRVFLRDIKSLEDFRAFWQAKKGGKKKEEKCAKKKLLRACFFCWDLI